MCFHMYASMCIYSMYMHILYIARGESTVTTGGGGNRVSIYLYVYIWYMYVSLIHVNFTPAAATEWVNRYIYALYV